MACAVAGAAVGTLVADGGDEEEALCAWWAGGHGGDINENTVTRSSGRIRQTRNDSVREKGRVTELLGISVLQFFFFFFFSFFFGC